MMNPKKKNSKKISARVMSAIALGGLLVVSFGLTGCSGEEEQPVVQERVAPPPPPPPPRAVVRSVEELRAELRIHDSVQMLSPESAPATTEERKAVLSFFDAFARGDHGALSRMLSDLDQRELERMVESGQWDEATDSIDDILIVQSGDSPNGKAVVALYDGDDGPQVQLWYYTGRGDEFTFEAAPTPPNMAIQLEGDDWIGAWHRILQAEMALADRTDQPIERRQQVLDEQDEFGGGGGGTRPPSAPGGPTVNPPPGGPGGPGRPSPPQRIPPGGRPPG